MLRRLEKTCVLTTFIIAVHTQAAEKGRIGIYHWGGERTRSMAAGVDRIVSLGGSVARIAYSPRYYLDYGIGEGCYPNYSLIKLAQEPDVARALDDERIRALILTTYDGLTFGDCYTHTYLSPSFYTPDNIMALKNEYKDSCCTCSDAITELDAVSFCPTGKVTTQSTAARRTAMP